MRQVGLSAPLLWILIAYPAASRAAEPADTRDAIKQMLAATWEASPTAAQELESLYDPLRNVDDWRVRYAYALAKMRQWQYAEATTLAEQLVEIPEAAVPARSMLAWLLLLQKKYAAALAQLEQLAAALPPTEKLNDLQRLRRQETIRRMGRMYGYLDGPASSALSEFERASRLRRIARLLSEEEMALFEEESSAVREQYLSRIDEKDRVVDETRRKAEEQRAMRLEELTAEQRGIADRLTAIQGEQEKVQKEFDEQLQAIEDRDAPLRARYERLDSEATVINRNLSYASAQIFQIEEQLLFEEDPVVRDLLYADLSRLSALASSYSRDFDRLERAAAVVQRERATIAAEQRQLENQYQAKVTEYANEQQRLARQARRNEVEQKRLLRERPRTTGQARFLTSQAQAFTTYVPFPFEDARQRLLESFGP